MVCIHKHVKRIWEILTGLDHILQVCAAGITFTSKELFPPCSGQEITFSQFPGFSNSIHCQSERVSFFSFSYNKSLLRKIGKKKTLPCSYVSNPDISQTSTTRRVKYRMNNNETYFFYFSTMDTQTGSPVRNLAMSICPRYWWYWQNINPEQKLVSARPISV